MTDKSAPATLHIRQTVEDFQSWKPVFDSHIPNRRAFGALGHQLFRDGNVITVLFEFPHRAAAEGFAADLLRRQASAESDDVGDRQISVLDAVESVEY